jgi:hypothetical protein
LISRTTAEGEGFEPASRLNYVDCSRYGGVESVSPANGPCARPTARQSAGFTAWHGKRRILRVEQVTAPRGHSRPSRPLRRHTLCGRDGAGGEPSSCGVSAAVRGAPPDSSRNSSPSGADTRLRRGRLLLAVASPLLSARFIASFSRVWTISTLGRGARSACTGARLVREILRGDVAGERQDRSRDARRL